MNMYLGIFGGSDAAELGAFRNEEAETVTALSRAAARHKLLYRDVWEDHGKYGWVLMHYERPHKYPLRDIVCLRMVTD